MISASIAETHRFGRVRKNGYDPAEVDAVVARLIDALRRNDERITVLTDKMDAADASADAIRKTFVAAQTTRDEILENARIEASTITETAEAAATELAEITERLQSDIAESREHILVAVYEDAEHRMLELERQAAQRSLDAEWAVKEAIEVRDRTVSDTEADSAAVAHRAEIEAAEVRARIATISRAAVGLEKAAEALATSAREGANVIDLSALEHLDQSKLPTQTPDVVVEKEPVLSVAESPEDTTRDDEMPKSRYQRSTGVPLKERIKIARMSG